MHRLILIFIGSLLLNAGGAFAQTDPKTGADRGNFPPDRHFDHLHMKLRIDIPDMGVPAFSAEQTLSLAAIGRDRSTIGLDAGRRIKVGSVTVNGAEQRFTHEGAKLSIHLASPARMGERFDAIIRYECEYPDANGMGLTWTKGSAREKSLTDQVPQIHSQGQPQHNHTWFPCHDFPNERATTELIVTVEDGYVVASNGYLDSTRFAGRRGDKTFTTWHWVQDKDHCYYLVSLVIGKLAIVGLPASPELRRHVRPNGWPLENYLYTPFGTEENAQRVYAKTPAMVEHFAAIFDEPYPWDKYSQAIVRDFAAGGMENTSATTMYEVSATARPGSQDDIIAHELGHQWFGDLLTCNSWEHGWLNEGWASFCEALWAEAEGKANPRRAYQRKIVSFLAAQRVMNRTYAPMFPALVSNRWGDPLETFMKPNDIYAKGAIVLHMLRQQLGDEIFFRATRRYIDERRHTTVETDLFRKVLESESGRSLERFFTQWCYRPGVPRLEVRTEWTGAEEGGGELRIGIRQTQRIDADNPAYYLEIPILLKHKEKGDRKVIVLSDGRESERIVRLDAEPEDIVVDPDMLNAAPARIVKPEAMWERQLDHESVFAQLQAVEHLLEIDEPWARRALARVAEDEGRVDVVRAAAERRFVRAWETAR